MVEANNERIKKTYKQRRLILGIIIKFILNWMCMCVCVCARMSFLSRLVGVDVIIERCRNCTRTNLHEKNKQCGQFNAEYFNWIRTKDANTWFLCAAEVIENPMTETRFQIFGRVRDPV